MMRVCYDTITQWPLRLDASVLTIGAFDGVHRGHQALLRQAQRRAWYHGVPFVILTFDPPPRTLFEGAKPLTSLTEKLRRLSAFSPDYVVVALFDMMYASLSAHDFIKKVNCISPLEIWVGPDFKFGKDRRGNVEMLSRYFNVEVFSKIRDSRGQIISSSRIRDLILNEKVEEARLLMGWQS